MNHLTLNVFKEIEVNQVKLSYDLSKSYIKNKTHDLFCKDNLADIL